MPPQTHPRTDREEIERLKRKYVAPIPHVKGSKPAYTQLFGESPVTRLPQTFAEVLPQLGIAEILPPDAEITDNPEAGDLADLTRAELVTMAVGLKLTVKPSETKDALIARIVEAKAANASQN